MTSVNHWIAHNEISKIAKAINVSLKEGSDSIFFRVDNEYAEGTIKSFEVATGIESMLLDITFFTDITLKPNNSNIQPISLMFCLEGTIAQKFDNEQYWTTINNQTNVIFHGPSNNQSRLLIPKNMPIKLSFINIYKEYMSEGSKGHKFQNILLTDLVGNLKNGEPYRFIGGIQLKISKCVKALINDKDTYILQKLLTEANILNILALQLKYHDQKCMMEKPLKKHEADKIIEIINYIENNISNPLSITTLSQEFGLSPAKMQAGFRSLYGETVTEKINSIRLNIAKNLLQTSELNVSQVVYGVGLQSRSYFSKIFKAQFGIAPRAYQNNC